MHLIHYFAVNVRYYRNKCGYSQEYLAELACLHRTYISAVERERRNISIENIRLIFNGVKNLDEVFKEQISVIENEVKQLNGAKIMCKKLSQEKSSVDTLDTDKYINIINSEEQKGNRFYDIADDYIFATEKLYQSIIENKEFKGGDSNFDLNTILLINDWH